jgi:EmrB/QacA subfamily drug resistance transporter
MATEQGTAMRAEPTERRRTRPAVVLAILSAASFLGTLDVWITNVGLDAIGKGVGSHSLSDLSWILNAYAIVFAALLVPGGRLADRYGRKGAFLVGLSVLGIASVGAAFSTDIWMLVGFRVLQAAGAALMTPASLGLVLTTAPAEKVGTYAKIWFTSGALAASVGPVLGGLLVQLSWRWLFLINLPFVVASLAAALVFVPNVRHIRDVRFPDVLGGALLMVGVGAVALGLVQGPSWGWDGGRTIGALALGLVATAAAVLRSARHPAPVIELSLFRNRLFTASNLSALLVAGSFGVFFLSTILWLEGHWGYSAIQTGFAIAPIPVMFATSAAIAESLQVKRGIRPGLIVGVGLVIVAVGILLLAVMIGDHRDYLGDFLPWAIITGFGFGQALPTSISSATVDLPAEDSATGSAIVNMGVQLGTVIGVSVLVAIGVATAAAPLHTFRDAWYTAAGVAVVGAFLAVWVFPASSPVLGEAPAPETA